MFAFLRKIWSDLIDSQLHWSIKSILLLAYISVLAFPFVFLSKLLHETSSDGLSLAYGVICLIALAVAAYFYYHRKKADTTLDEAKETLQQAQQLQNSNNSNQHQLEQLQRYIIQLQKEKEDLQSQLHQEKEDSRTELLQVKEQNHSELQQVKELYQQQLEAYKQQIVDEHHELIHGLATKYGQEQSKHRYAALKETFALQHHDEIERLARQKAKEYINKELPFDL